MIVLGTYFVQSSQITVEPIFAGIVSGGLSSTVLVVNSFPDYDADKAHGRKTLVIVLGKAKAATTEWMFPIISYGIIVASVVTHISLLIPYMRFFTLPSVINSGLSATT